MVYQAQSDKSCDGCGNGIPWNKSGSLPAEWHRIEPEQGKIDQEAVAHYHKIFDCIRRWALAGDIWGGTMGAGMHSWLHVFNEKCLKWLAVTSAL